MNALDLLLTSSELPACDACRHARASADGLYCARRAGAPYPCQIERGSALVEAWLYGACGRHGRFFEPAAARELARKETRRRCEPSPRENQLEV